MHLLLLTLVRKGELLGARWEHVDLDKAVWEIPADHMKMGKPHVVHLSRQAVELFQELRKLASTSEFVLPGRSSLRKPFAHNAVNKALKVALQGSDIPAFTIHDLRRTASTCLNELGFRSEVIEKALAHELGGVRGVYNKAEYGHERRSMLQSWADYVERLIARNVIPLGRVA
jgi:integrase